MMNILALSVIVGILLIVFVNIFPRKKSLFEKYSRMGQRDLLLANISSKRLIRISLIVAFIGPLLLGYITSLVLNKSVQEIIFALSIILVSSSFAMCAIHWRISDITEAELKYREKPKE